MRKSKSFDGLLAQIRTSTVCAPHLVLGPRPILRGRPSARLLIISQYSHPTASLGADTRRGCVPIENIKRCFVFRVLSIISRWHSACTHYIFVCGHKTDTRTPDGAPRDKRQAHRQDHPKPGAAGHRESALL